MKKIIISKLELPIVFFSSTLELEVTRLQFISEGQ